LEYCYLSIMGRTDCLPERFDMLRRFPRLKESFTRASSIVTCIKLYDVVILRYMHPFVVSARYAAPYVDACSISITVNNTTYEIYVHFNDTNDANKKRARGSIG
jgi:hypothetical protein